MRKLCVLLSLILAVAVVTWSQNPPPQQPQQAGAQGAKTHKLAAEVVSADAQAATITIKGEDGKEATAKVDAAAAKSLANLKAGDKVTLTCRDNDAGQHEAIVAIEKAAPKSGDANPPKS